MVELAVADEPGLSASSIDAPLPGGQPNYTFDTLQRLRSRLQPEDVLFFLLGRRFLPHSQAVASIHRPAAFLRLHRCRKAWVFP